MKVHLFLSVLLVTIVTSLAQAQQATTKSAVHEGASVNAKLNENGVVLLHMDEEAAANDLNSGIAVFWDNGHASVLMDGVPINVVSTGIHDQNVLVEAEATNLQGDSETVFVSFDLLKNGTLFASVTFTDGSDGYAFIVDQRMAKPICMCFRNSAVRCGPGTCTHNDPCVWNGGGGEVAWCEERSGTPAYATE